MAEKDIKQNEGRDGMDEINAIIKGWLRMDGDLLICHSAIFFICCDLLTESRSPVRSFLCTFLKLF